MTTIVTLALLAFSVLALGAGGVATLVGAIILSVCEPAERMIAGATGGMGLVVFMLGAACTAKLIV